MTARLIILNTCWLAALLAATILGYTAFVFNGDGSYVSYVVAAILAGSIVATFTKRKEHILPAAWLCETLGFVGTLIGITIGLCLLLCSRIFCSVDLFTKNNLTCSSCAHYRNFG